MIGAATAVIIPERVTAAWLPDGSFGGKVKLQVNTTTPAIFGSLTLSVDFSGVMFPEAVFPKAIDSKRVSIFGLSPVIEVDWSVSADVVYTS